MKDKNSPGKSPGKILVKGSIGNFNFGDDLLIFSMIKCLGSYNYDLEIEVFSRSAYISRFVEDAKLVGESNKRNSYDLLLYAGGTQFATFRKWESQLLINYLEQIILLIKKPSKIIDKIKKIWSKRSATSYRKIALVGVGVGPFFEHDSFFNKTIDLLKGSHFVAVRDVLSLEICKTNGIKCKNGSDLIFSLPKKYWIPFKTNVNKKKKIAFIIRDWEYSKEKASFIKQIATITKENEVCRIISFCEPRDKKGIGFLLKEGYGDKLDIWDPENMQIEDFLYHLSSFDLFVTTRYHGALVAALMGKPFMSIGIEPKLTMVAEKFNMPIWNYPYSIDDFKNSIKSIDENYSAMTQSVNDIIEVERDKNEEMLDGLNVLLDDILKS
jgi:polysaccharide pyruvyl transferase WcaK-like protein